MYPARARLARVLALFVAIPVAVACSSQKKNTEKKSSGELESEKRSSKGIYDNDEAEEASDDESSSSSEGPDMTLEKMNTIIREMGDEVQRNERVWKFEFKGTKLSCITDPRHDRMRLVSPIVEASKVTERQMTEAMQANFHTALDARYGISRGVMYSAFVHPLSTLDPEDFRSAIEQVANLAQSFGTSYSSGVLQFGGGGGP